MSSWCRGGEITFLTVSWQVRTGLGGGVQKPVLSIISSRRPRPGIWRALSGLDLGFAGRYDDIVFDDLGDGAVNGRSRVRAE